MPDRPRVVVVGINYVPETTGIAPYTTAMVDALARADMRVRVVTGIPHYPAWRVSDPRYASGRRWDETIHGLPVTRVAHHVPRRADLGGRIRMELDFFRRARREVARLAPDAVIAVTPSLSGVAAAVLGAHGVPVGVVVQDLTGAGAAQSGTTGAAVGRLIASAEARLLRRASCVGVITERFGELLVQQGVNADRIVDLPNFAHVVAVDATTRQARKRLGWPVEGTTVVHTGNMGMKQGLESVVAAARLADEGSRDVTFVVVGDGNQRAELEQRAADVRRVRFLDPVGADDYPYVLAAADVLLLNERPGVREMSMPSKLTSYVSAARPVVAAVEAGGITCNTLAEYDAAEIVPPGDPEALIAGIDRVMTDQARRKHLVERASVMLFARYGRAAAEARYVAFARRLLR